MQDQIWDYLRQMTDYINGNSLKKSHHITRHTMYKRLSNVLLDHDSSKKQALSISSSLELAHICGINQAEIINTEYPEYNVLDLPFPQNSFDFIFLDQIIEHVRGDVFKLFRDLALLLKPNGYIVSASPFFTEIHNCPVDCFRFTIEGYKVLAEQSNLEIIQCDSWGNRLAWLHIFLGHRFTPVPLDNDNPILKLAEKDEKFWPIHVWLVAKKPQVEAGRLS